MKNIYKVSYSPKNYDIVQLKSYGMIKETILLASSTPKAPFDGDDKKRFFSEEAWKAKAKPVAEADLDQYRTAAFASDAFKNMVIPQERIVNWKE